jgi:hypothetical protein
MPWYGIRSMKQVEIRLGSPNPKAKDQFLGIYQLAGKTLEITRQKLRESMSTTTLPDYRKPETKEEFRDPCFHPCRYNSKRGFTDHNPERCDGGAFDPEMGVIMDSTCSVEVFYKNSKQLTRLNMEPLRKLLFQNLSDFGDELCTVMVKLCIELIEQALFNRPC